MCQPYIESATAVSHNIYNIYSIPHILTIVFPDARNVKYLPIICGSYSTVYFFLSSKHRVVTRARK